MSQISRYMLIALVAALIGTLTGFAFSGGGSVNANQASEGRFQMMKGNLDVGDAFLLDSETGEVWILVSSKKFVIRLGEPGDWKPKLVGEMKNE